MECCELSRIFQTRLETWLATTALIFIRHAKEPKNAQYFILNYNFPKTWNPKQWYAVMFLLLYYAKLKRFYYAFCAFPFKYFYIPNTVRLILFIFNRAIVKKLLKLSAWKGFVFFSVWEKMDSNFNQNWGKSLNPR